METTATILHADLDAFYASVEQLLDPSLRGKPIAVGGGVVLAASYEARAFGVRGGMPGRRARELCPHLIFVGGHFSEYQRLGDAAIKVLGDFTPLVERISIDEAFADVAGCTHLFGPPAEIARAIRAPGARRAWPADLGRRRAHQAPGEDRLASGQARRAGGGRSRTELDFLHDLPVELMWGVGPVTKARLAETGVHTIGQLAKMPGWSLERLLGPRRRREARRRSPGIAIRARSGRSGARARPARSRRSAGGRRKSGSSVPTLHHLADRIASRLRAKSRPGRTVTVRVRFADLRSVTRSLTLDAPIAATAIARRNRRRAGAQGARAITPTRRRSRCWRSRCRISRSARTCSSNCRLGLPTTGAGPAPDEAWRAGGRPRRRRDPRSFRLGGGRLRLGRAGALPFRPRRVPRTGRKGSLKSQALPTDALSHRARRRYASQNGFLHLVESVEARQPHIPRSRSLSRSSSYRD